MNSIINRKSGEHNVGSILKLFWIEKEGISTGLPKKNYTLPTQVLDTVDLLRPSGIGWKAAQYIFDEILWETEEESTPDGILYKEKISFDIAKHYHARRGDFDDMEYREYIVFAQDMNGQGTIFGYDTLDGERHGMRFSKKKTTGRARKSRNEYSLMFYMEGYCQPWPSVSTDPDIEYDPGPGGGT